MPRLSSRHFVKLILEHRAGDRLRGKSRNYVPELCGPISVPITAREAFPISLCVVAETGVMEVMRSLRIVALAFMSIIGTGLVPIMVALVLGCVSIAEDLLTAVVVAFIMVRSIRIP